MSFPGAEDMMTNMPKIVLMTKAFLPSRRDLAMAAFAFMHCSLFAGYGDIELAAKGEAVRTIKKKDMPDDFEEFYSLYRRSGADGFHARCTVPGKKVMAPFSGAAGGCLEDHQYMLISRGYSFVHDIMCGSDGAAIFHPGFGEDARVYESIRNETMDKILKLQAGERI